MTESEAGFEVLSSGGEERGPEVAPRRTTGRRPSGRAIGIGSLALALLAGGGAFAAARSSGASDEPESVLPRTAFAFAKVDLQPGGAQSGALSDFVKRFPTAHAQTAEQFREVAVKALTKSLHLNYTADVLPWLGRRAALAGFPGADGKPAYVVALQVNDLAAAKAALARLAHPPAVAGRRGYAVIAKDQPTLDAALAGTQDTPLAKDAEFASDLDRLAGAQVAVGWIDNSAAADAMLYNIEHPEPGSDFGGADAYVQKMRAGAVGRTVMGLHATSTYAELVGYTVGRTGAVPAGRPADLLALPGATIGAAYVADSASLLTGSGGGAFGGFGFAGPMPLLSLGLTPLLFGGLRGTTEITPLSASASSCTMAPPAPGESAPPDACLPAPSMMAMASAPADAPAQPSCALSSASPGDAASCLPSQYASAVPSVAPTPSASSYVREGQPLPPATAEHPTLPPMPPDSVGYEDPMTPLLKEFAGVLKDGMTISLGSLPLPTMNTAPKVALIAPVNDAAGAQAAAAKAKEQFAGKFGAGAYSQVKDGVLTLASDSAYAATLRAGELGKTDLFRVAMGDLGEHVEMALFANLEGVRDVVPGYPKPLLPVSAIGVSTVRNGDVSEFRLRLVSR